MSEIGMLKNWQPFSDLGTLLSDSVDNHREICNRLAAASATCHRLKLFLGQSP